MNETYNLAIFGLHFNASEINKVFASIIRPTLRIFANIGSCAQRRFRK